MTSLSQKHTVTKGCARAFLKAALPLALAVTSMFGGGAAWAGEVVGVIAHLSGPLLDRKADGSTRVLGPKSEVENGDTLVAEKTTYAQIRFIDKHEITLKPNTTFRIDNFTYDAAKPEGDSAAFSLVKGGLRSITGLLGKRNKEKFSLKTPSATIGIRGTTFIVEYVPPTAAPTAAQSAPGFVPSAPIVQASAAPLATATLPVLPTASTKAATPGLAPGLYVSVQDGMIALSNTGGAQTFAAGQFGYVPSTTQAPVIVPANPALQFTPPPVFSAPAGATPAATGSAQSNVVNCEVR
jgi:hypothetical protein